LLTKEGRRIWLAQVAALPGQPMNVRQKALRHLSEIDGDYEMAKLTVIQQANQLAAEGTQTTVKIVRPGEIELPPDAQELLEGKLVEMPQEPALPEFTNHFSEVPAHEREGLPDPESVSAPEDVAESDQHVDSEPEPSE